MAIGIEIEGPLAAHARAWRWKSDLRVTVVAKITWRYERSGALELAAPRPIHVADHRRSDGGGLRAGSDLAPYLPSAQVLVFGSVRGQPHDREVVARMRLERGATVLVSREETISAPAVRPSSPTWEQPVLAWAARPLPEAMVRDVANILGLPETFDPGALCSAPPEQRPASLEAGDTLVLERLHRGQHAVRLVVPGVAVLARADFRGVPVPLALRADTLVVDADAGELCLVYRGSFPLHSEAALAQARARLSLAASAPGPCASAPASAAPVSSTETLHVASSVPASAPLPFTTGSAQPPPSSEPRDQHLPGSTGTEGVSPEVLAKVLASRPTPFVRPAPAAADVASVGTVALSRDLLRKAAEGPATPFPAVAAGERPAPPPDGALPFRSPSTAPVEASRFGPPAPAVAAQGAAPEGAAPPLPVADAAPPAKPAAEVVWAQPLEAPLVVAPPAAAPRARPRKNLNDLIYGGGGKR